MRRISSLCLALVLLISTFGTFANMNAGSSKPSVHQPYQDELALRVAVPDDITTLNPLIIDDEWSWKAVEYIYDTPMTIHYVTDQIYPYVAVGSANLSSDVSTVNWDDCTIGTYGHNQKNSWANPDKPETIIFYDFENVTWHDDVQMEIRDILFSYHVAAQVPAWTRHVNCLKDKGGGTGSNYPLDHRLYIDLVWASGDNLKAALKFTMQVLYADFFKKTLAPYLLPYHIWGSTISGQSIDNTKIWYDPGYLPGSADAWNFTLATMWDNTNPIGSGPFEWSNRVLGLRFKILTWRDHFYKEGWNPLYDYDEIAAQPNIDAISFRIYPSSASAVDALKKCEVDYIAWSIPTTYVPELQNITGVVTLQVVPERGFSYLAYNMRNETFGYNESASFPYAPEDDFGKPLRRAIAHCIDKQNIVQNLLMNYGLAGDGTISMMELWYNSSIPKYAFDTMEANNILDNAGYFDFLGDGWRQCPNGENLSFDILTPDAGSDPVKAQTGLMIANQLQLVGLNASCVFMDNTTLMNRVNSSDFNIYISEWEIDTEPYDFLYYFFHSSNVTGINYPAYQNSSFDSIIEHARTTGDEWERKQDIRDCQASIPYDLPYDVLYHELIIEAYRSDSFIGWHVGPYGSVYCRMSIFNIKKPWPYDSSVTFDIPVQPGWNFISVPLVQEDTLILEVLDDDGGDTSWNYAYRYDITDTGNEWKSYLKGRPSSLNDLTDINHTMGFIVNITDVGSDGNLTVRGTYPSTMDIILYEGWNMVGYPAIDDSVLTVGDVKASTGNNVTGIHNRTDVPYDDTYVLKRGEGYWFNVSSNCTWTIENKYKPHGPIRINSNFDFAVTPGVTGGNGTEANPWTIEGWDINGTGYGYCIYIGNTTEYFIVSDCLLHEASGGSGFFFANTGLICYNASLGLLHNIKALNSVGGVYLYNSHNCSIQHCDIDQNLLGINNRNANGTEIINNTLTNGVEGIIIQEQSSNFTILSNIIENYSLHGIYMEEQCQYGLIKNNTIHNNTLDGIRIISGSNMKILSNNIYNNKRHGIYIWWCHYNIISDNQICLNDEYGISVWSTLNNTINNNLITNNHIGGNYLVISYFNIIQNNTISKNEKYGLYAYKSENNTLLNNIIRNMKGEEGQNGLSATGIYLENSTFNTIRGNDIFNITGGDCQPYGFPGPAYGIQLLSSSNNSILENNISDIKNGEHIYFKDDMESGSSLWEHSSTIMLINGEIPLEYFWDTELDTDIISDWNNTVSVGLETTTATYHSFNTSFYMNETNNNKTAVTETSSLVNLEKANLSFWQKYNLTVNENGGFLQVGYKDPANGGVSDWDWKYITPAMYTGNLNASAQVNDSFGTPVSECWNGVSSNGTFDWEYVGIDILSYVPIAYRSEVRIKFNYTNLGGAGTGGWYLDDVRLLVSRDENGTLGAGDKDIWNLTNMSAIGMTAHSGNYAWSNVDPITGDMKPGIDNYLTTKPIDLTSVMNANFTAYLKFNINEDSGAPPDGFRVEVSTDTGLSWSPINLGVRAGWGVSGTGQDIDDGAIDGKAFTGLPESGNPIADDYWVNASSLSRVNANLSHLSGNVIQIRFRVANSNNVTYEHNNNHNQVDPGFGGFYVDDVEVHAKPIFPSLTDSKAILLGNSFNNTIYHNNFMNNGDNAEDDGINFWDDGYPSGGNYWDDYADIDLYYGLNQDQPGSDGIGDANYTNIQDGSNIDEYPLMSPFEYNEYDISLQQGWNLISLPVRQLNWSIDSVLESIAGKWNCIQTYDSTTDFWLSNNIYRPTSLNDLDEMNHLKAYWINITEPGVTLTVKGDTFNSTLSIPLYAGWNLVGYPSLNTETVGNALWGTGADKVEVFDPAEPYRIKEVGPSYVMKPGEGYWVHVPADTIWVVDW